jgi:2-polyprenyl-3-methyl-5-hydroxy-6-metoxy-1,4-benzoquinol methylase
MSHEQMASRFVEFLRDTPIEEQRFMTLKQTLSGFSHVFRGRRVLDFGASYGLSACALLELGASRVIGVEPNEERVRKGARLLEQTGFQNDATIIHTPDTRKLDLETGSVEVVIANAVLEHIPRPRTAHVRELWRVLAPEGHLIINETPNSYIPIDYHTTDGLWFVPWLPSRLARSYAIWRRRFSEDEDWDSSGWRGLGFYEIVAGFDSPYEYIGERSRFRHRALSWLNLPSALLDPYPLLIFKKP